MIVAKGLRVQLCCDLCFRTSPSKEGPPDHAERQFRALGWWWRDDGRLLCPICNAREATLPPPEPSSQ